VLDTIINNAKEQPDLRLTALNPAQNVRPVAQVGEHAE